MLGARWARVVLVAGMAAALGACGGQLGRPDGGGTAGVEGSGTGAAGAVATGGSGAAGTTGAGGATGTAGTGAGGAGTGFGEPACPSGIPATVYPGGPCGPSDVQFCYKRCGPQNVGVRSAMCVVYLYEEMSGCAFDPNADYSCYKIPTVANAVCPSGVMPQAATPCDVPPCTLCNSLQGMTGGSFLDSTGAPKTGWCVCRPPDAAGARTWSCASNVAWPCPLGSGC